MYYCYVLHSPKFDKIYIGQTDNLDIRIERHNLGFVRSTKSYVPWKLIYSEKFETRSEAMRREKQLKSYQGRQFIRKQFLNGRVRQLAD